MAERSPKTADGAGTGVRGTEGRPDDPPLDLGTESIEAARRTGDTGPASDDEVEVGAEGHLDAEHGDHEPSVDG